MKIPTKFLQTRNQRIVLASTLVILGHGLGFYLLCYFTIESDKKVAPPAFEQVVKLELKKEVKQEVRIEKPSKTVAPSLSMTPMQNVKVPTFNTPKITVKVTSHMPSAVITSKSVSMANFKGLGKNGPKMSIPAASTSGFGSKKKVDGAFKGTLYFFDTISQIKTETNEWFQGTNRDKKSSQLYATKLEIAQQDFTKGFPGISKQSAFFGIDFISHLKWPKGLEGDYEFKLTSDDGSLLLIDGVEVINNDGMHGMITKTGSHYISSGDRNFRILYFQGAPKELGLIFEYRKKGTNDWKIFDTTYIMSYAPPSYAMK